jgi:GDPmannose 4,6-dehydratase
MSKKKAFITGITGQDGAYLTEHLLELGYEVHGLVRRNSVTENQQSRIQGLMKNVNLKYGDMLDQSSIDKLLKETAPHEIYNLAAQSHVRVSFDIPQFTVQTNALGVLNLLESAKLHCPEAKIYQASSSEMFGNSRDQDGMQRETTPMHPVSPYGCAKLFSYSLIRNYRKAYKLFASNGILFNHESPRRGSNFVTTKIIKNAVLISKGKLNKLELGNLDSKRDWGHSKDYVKAMHLILNHNKPDDFVISTGETHSIRDLCKLVFSKLNLNYEEYVKVNPKFIRPEELNYLCGDSSKSKKLLGWKPEYTFEELVDEMLVYFLNQYKNQNFF